MIFAVGALGQHFSEGSPPAPFDLSELSDVFSF